jgi:hypothetical protein
MKTEETREGEIMVEEVLEEGILDQETQEGLIPDQEIEGIRIKTEAGVMNQSQTNTVFCALM